MKQQLTPAQFAERAKTSAEERKQEILNDPTLTDDEKSFKIAQLVKAVLFACLNRR